MKPTAHRHGWFLSQSRTEEGIILKKSPGAMMILES